QQGRALVRGVPLADDGGPGVAVAGRRDPDWISIADALPALPLGADRDRDGRGRQDHGNPLGRVHVAASDRRAPRSRQSPTIRSAVWTKIAADARMPISSAISFIVQAP